MAVEKGSIDAKNNLAALYYQKNDISKKAGALKITEEILKDSDPIVLTTRIAVLLWNEKIKEAFTLLGDILEKYLPKTEAFQAISNALIYFLIFKQKQFLYNLFAKNGELKDRFKPVYFALLHEMKNEFPDEYLKMTEEISEPVNDLLKFVKEERQRLGIS